MDVGTYTSATAGILAEIRVDITNNNLANINTPGFKRHMLVTRQEEYGDTLTNKIANDVPFAREDFDRNPGAEAVGTFIDFSLGSIKQTGNPLDVALKSENQFFAVSTPDGEKYTKAGNFTLDAVGNLVTSDGFKVSGVGGPITINEGIPIISDSGQVRVNGQTIAQLKVVNFDDTKALKADGGNLYSSNGVAKITVEDNPNLESGALEMSNVSAIRSMLDLIKANRGFELYQKTAKSLDEINQQAVSNLLGR